MTHGSVSAEDAIAMYSTNPQNCPIRPAFIRNKDISTPHVLHKNGLIYFMIVSAD